MWIRATLTKIFTIDKYRVQMSHTHTHIQMLLLLLTSLLQLLWSLNGFNVRQMSMSCNKSPCYCGGLDDVCSLPFSLTLENLCRCIWHINIVIWLHTNLIHTNIHGYTLHTRTQCIRSKYKHQIDNNQQRVRLCVFMRKQPCVLPFTWRTTFSHWFWP